MFKTQTMHDEQDQFKVYLDSDWGDIESGVLGIYYELNSRRYVKPVRTADEANDPDGFIVKAPRNVNLMDSDDVWGALSQGKLENGKYVRFVTNGGQALIDTFYHSNTALYPFGQDLESSADGKLQAYTSRKKVAKVLRISAKGTKIVGEIQIL